MGTVNTFVGNNFIIDFEIFSLWVDGYTAEECMEQLSKRDPIVRETKDSIILRDVLDHYLLFNKLEQYLYSPPNLKEQLLFQVSDELANQLIEKYYEYDSFVMRDFLGLRLTQRQRKDLDDISEKTGCKVRSCRRQFDNLKRINRITDDLKGSLVSNIVENFLLPAKLAEQYAAIVFIIRHQFEMSKRKLNHLSLDDFIYCASQMLKNWSGTPNVENEAEFSRDFLINLKDLRILIEKEFIDDHKKLIIAGVCNLKTTNLLPLSSAQLNQLNQQQETNRQYQLIEQNFKELSKALIDIAYALNHSKDMKDIFVDIYEQFIEPCCDNQWTKNDVKLFLDEYKKRAHQLQNICRDNPKLLTVFDRYMTTITNCIIKMYHF